MESKMKELNIWKSVCPPQAFVQRVKYQMNWYIDADTK